MSNTPQKKPPEPVEIEEYTRLAAQLDVIAQGMEAAGESIARKAGQLRGNVFNDQWAEAAYTAGYVGGVASMIDPLMRKAGQLIDRLREGHQ